MCGCFEPNMDDPMDDFVDWKEANQLIHLPTRVSLYTWSNRRVGNVDTEK